MELNFSAVKLIALRKLRALSQDKLAEKAGINIRTLQRIEKSEVKPQLYTLGRLADSLSVAIEDLCSSDTKSPPEEKSPGQLSLLHFSALAGCVFPLGNIIAPYAIWVYKKNTGDAWNSHARYVLNFQISWLVYLFTAFILYFSIASLGFLVFLFPFIILFSNIICPVISGMQVLKNRRGFYPLTIKFIQSNTHEAVI